MLNGRWFEKIWEQRENQLACSHGYHFYTVALMRSHTWVIWGRTLERISCLLRGCSHLCAVHCTIERPGSVLYKRSAQIFHLFGANYTALVLIFRILQPLATRPLWRAGFLRPDMKEVACFVTSTISAVGWPSGQVCSLVVVLPTS